MIGFKMPVFPASVDFVVNGEVIDVLPKSLGAFPVLDSFGCVLESGAAHVLRELRGLDFDWGLAVWAGFHSFSFWLVR